MSLGLIQVIEARPISWKNSVPKIKRVLSFSIRKERLSTYISYEDAHIPSLPADPVVQLGFFNGSRTSGPSRKRRCSSLANRRPSGLGGRRFDRACPLERLSGDCSYGRSRTEGDGLEVDAIGHALRRLDGGDVRVDED